MSWSGTSARLRSGESDSALCLELAESLEGCRSGEALQAACTRVATLFGYERYHFSGYIPQIGHITQFSDFPAEWCRRYAERGYLSVDPIVRHCWTHTSLLRWSEVRYSRGRVSAAERRVMKEARDFGLRHGISVSAHGPGAEGGVLSLASADSVPGPSRGMELSLRLLAHSLYEALKTITLDASEAAPSVPELTRREAQCLRWTANGKTSWEVAQILEISESTAIFHLRNAIAKLEAANRPQAVARAIEHSRILPF